VKITIQNLSRNLDKTNKNRMKIKMDKWALQNPDTKDHHLLEDKNNGLVEWHIN